ncbi:MAG: hypothetical protein IPK85_03020 [Gemmatimonadetes bacterium]|nr:hypothetical protein [Gemmatimonadota bacterium]
MTSATVCFGCGAVFSHAVPVGTSCEACSRQAVEMMTIAPGSISTSYIGPDEPEPFEEWVGNLEATAASTWASVEAARAERRRAYLEEVEAARAELEPVIERLRELGEEPDEGAVEAARTLLPVHSEEQLKRISEFGCSSLSLVDRPCGMCADCTPEDRLVPPLFAVADLPGFDDVAVRRLAEIEFALDEGVREPAPPPRPRPWLLPVMVALYPVALVVALTTEVGPTLCRVTGCGCRGLRQAGQVLARAGLRRGLQVVAGVLAIAVVLGCVIAVGAFVMWLWSLIGWWTIPLAVLVGWVATD